jgi:hypothetical protein
MEKIMAIEDNGPQSAYPGPAEPDSDEEVYPDAENDNHGNKNTDPSVIPDVDEDEESAPGNSI